MQDRKIGISGSHGSLCKSKTSCRQTMRRLSAKLHVVAVVFIVSWAWIAFVSVHKMNLIGNVHYESDSQQRGWQQQHLQQRSLQRPIRVDDKVPCIANERSNRRRGAQYALKYTLQNPPPTAYNILHGVFTPFSIGPRIPPELLSHNQTMQQRTFDRARFRIFQAFCAASMKYQTSLNAFWIVLVDERIEPQLLRDLETTLSGLWRGDDVDDPSRTKNKNEMPSPYLVALSAQSSEASGTMNSFGWHDLVREYETGNVRVITGDNAKLVQALDRIKPHSSEQTSMLRGGKIQLVLETALDVQFGLNSRGIEWIQDVVVDHYAKAQQQQRGQWWGSYPTIATTTPSTWWYLCGTGHLEWHNPDIFFLRKSLYDEQGVSSGRTGLRVHPHVCASGGLTRVGQLGSSTETTATNPNVPPGLLFRATLDVSRVLDRLPPCNTIGGSNSESNHRAALVHSECLVRSFSETPLVIEARGGIALSEQTKTPNDIRSMAGSNGELDGPLLINATELDWEILKYDFNIDRYSIWEISVYLYDHVVDVLLGHPCAMAEALATNTKNGPTNTNATDALCRGWDQRALMTLLEQVTNREVVQLKSTYLAKFANGKKFGVSNALGHLQHQFGVKGIMDQIRPSAQDSHS